MAGPKDRVEYGMHNDLDNDENRPVLHDRRGMPGCKAVDGTSSL